MIKVCGLVHGVKISQQQVWDDTCLMAVLLARIGCNHKITRGWVLPQAIQGPGGKNKAAFHSLFTPRSVLVCQPHMQCLLAGKVFRVQSQGRMFRRLHRFHTFVFLIVYHVLRLMANKIGLPE